MSKECVRFVNERCKSNGYLNRLYGVKKKDGSIYGKILPEEKEVYWLPITQLSVEQEKYIREWIELGGEINE